MPPDASPTTATVPAAKPRRRPKAKRPAAPVPTTPRKPRATVLSRIAAMGPTHVLAYRTLAEGNDTFTQDVAEALRADADHDAAVGSLNAAHRAVADAERRVTETQRARDAGRVTLAKLDRLARDIATARGDVPTNDATDPAVAPVSAAD